MRTLKTVKDNDVTKVSVPYNEIEWIRFLYGSLKYISEWEKETGADIVMNGALFEGNGKPIETFKSGGQSYFFK